MGTKLKSIRTKLFLTLVVVVIVIIIFLIALNNFVLETFYLFSKQRTLINTYKTINSYYNNEIENVDIELELEKIAFQNSFDIMIRGNNNTSIYTSNKDFLSSLGQITSSETYIENIKESILYSKNNIVVRKLQDNKNGLNFILLTGRLDNSYTLYIRMPVSSIRESVKISNNFLYLVGSFTIIVGGFVVLYISKKFTGPIVELNDIAKRMSILDFSKKFRITDADDEINELGKSMNKVSEKLENTINQLKRNNNELERDIEKKSKIDEMRKQFISDVSHELKTPISIIQGYAEGLVENVATDEEAKKLYAEVILDEANKMDVLVKQLLELMKLEYGKREFNNTNFNIVELIQDVIKRSKVLQEQKEAEVQFNFKEPVYVHADNFYIEQVMTNYYTNAIKHVEKVENEKKIQINIQENKDKIRISIFNTGENIPEEEMQKIWNRFYKIDSSRNRENGGSGIGLSLVKAIMNNYGNDYGVINQKNGVEFYFELDKGRTEEELQP